ncbi:AAA family ATPase [Bradyrhizobium sp. AUGA SZCCT0177]|uniref:AAA family ATPase n=1 Tax=Bradyrhizobium sp. AUGA SZCCT0177 TaxID=2807665 RepID=UPI001BACBC3B|nr:AAA family ATPase [Bradyrhizobium sp. AUGA SZCCT0177]MBR1281300.1 AAA family ATPase [Bradyrhizobium sp. AUGA SZCCT0177]
MGPLELATYRRHWRQSIQFHHQIEEAAAFGRRAGRGFGALRNRSDGALDFDSEEEADQSSANRSTDRPPDAGRVAVELQLSRYFDERSDLLTAVLKGAPTILVDVADPRALSRVSQAWQDLFFQGRRKVDIVQQGFRRRQELDVLFMTVGEPPKSATVDEREKAALHGLSLGLPFFGISPLARSHLPSCLIKAASTKFDFPRIDAMTIERTIRIVTARRCESALDCSIGSGATVEDLIIAIRFDRTPEQCIGELGRLADLKHAKAGARGLVLSQLHGLGEARAWAKDSIADIQAWKQGRIPWSAVSSAIALEGPPGCGKTTFASVYCAEAGLYMVGDANMAAWQSSGEGHLGHLLRAMKKSFEEARANAPACIIIDECDSVGARNLMSHSHRDYSVQVVNALLAEIDGIKGREGVVIIGCSNDLSRCDPALLRAGRLEKIIRIGLPDVAELERMFRVRLQNDLRGDDLMPLAELAIGMVGADVERIVKDARRATRNEGDRAITLDDLKKALLGEDDRSEQEIWVACAHEAAHIVVDVLHFGPEGVFASVAATATRGGMVARPRPGRLLHTADDYGRRLQAILAGRVGETLIFGKPSHGAGGKGGDIDQATQLACAMIGSLGLAGPTPLIFRAPAGETERLLGFPDVRRAVNAELQRQAEACRLLLEDHRDAMLSVAQRLRECGRIDGAEVADRISACSVAARGMPA